MGMQVHFSAIDLVRAGIKVEYVKDDPVEGYEDSYTAQFFIGENDTMGYAVPLNIQKQTMWQDIGSANTRQMALIAFLIKNRIPFNAS